MAGVLSRCFLPVYLRRALSSSIQSQPSHEVSLKHQPLLDDSWKTAQPAGSTLFPECELFNPFVKPEPRHQWDAIQHSLRCRGISIPFDLHQLSDFKSTLDSISRKISVLDSERRAIHTSFHGNEVPESAKFEIRRLRAEQKELKVSFRALLGRYWKPILELPNSIHTECPVGNEPRILKTFEPKSTSETVSWNQVKQSLHHTPIGTYKTGLLAELEHSQLDLATTRWLDQDATFFPSVSSYPVSLSDFARGPAVEACAWDPISQIARVEPSHDDCIQVPADPSTGSSVRWIVNPHSSCYLVGSASLASFTAYILRQQFRTQSALPLRLVSLGSVYHRSSGADVLPLDGESASHHQQPFQQRKQLSIAELSSSQRLCEQGFFQLVEDMYRFWTTFQPTWPLRLCYLPAGDLRPCEMLRAVIQLTERESSPDGERHSGLTTVASVSLLDDWVSRRIGAKLSRSIAEFDPSEPFIRMTYAQIMDSYSLLTAFRRIGNMSISTI